MPKKSDSSKSYRRLSEELNAVLEWFDKPDPDLDEAVANYQKATSLIAEMEKYLKTAQNEVKKITPK